MLLTAGALVLFAANSVVCKLALGRGAIDPAGFTVIRLTSGAAVLFLLVKFSGSGNETIARGSWVSAGMLFLYAVCFSYAYMTLEAGTGALILFGAVQLTMIAGAIASGERPGPMEWAGGIAAFSGLVYLVFPGLVSPSPAGSCLMVTAGIAWGFYSINGKGVKFPLAETKNNFIRSLAFAGLLLLPMWQAASPITPWGVLLALISGALASGVGYALWYAVVLQIKTAQAGIVQLLVPVLAALGGILFLEEQITLRLMVSTLIISGGICLSLAGQTRNGFSKQSGCSGKATTIRIIKKEESKHV